MQVDLSLKVLPSEAADSSVIHEYLASATGNKLRDVKGYYILKRSIDARAKTTWINLTCRAFINEPYHQRSLKHTSFKDVRHASKIIVIVGAGPAGIFAALKLIESGIKPVLLDRGKDVRARRRDLARLNKEGIINPNSNYCFGEGGAGTYSDGKLYTRSTKRGDVEQILNLFVQFGAEENILYDAHPHIGTNKLPAIITAMRDQIIACGGECRFENKVIDLLIEKGTVKGVITEEKELVSAHAVIIASGHSARDIFQLLHYKKLSIESKPFALGVRVEHPQEIIDEIQYHCASRGPYLPPASYSLVEQVGGRGVFSFCMCPGGIIAPASTSEGELVVNGWSPSRRNNPFANSGMVVGVEPADLKQFERFGPLAAMHFQQEIEKSAFQCGGGRFVAPAQRLEDFIRNKTSSSLPNCSYLPGIHSADLRRVLPATIHARLKEGFQSFGKKMKGWLSNEAVLVATESRTSSPVRIPRDKETLQHPQVHGLFPCGEGAGYAGGIVSAAMDGHRVAEAIRKLVIGDR